MAHTDWMIRGSEVASCNCSYGCPMLHITGHGVVK